MASLKSIRIEKQSMSVTRGKEILLDWDNDRHQRIPIKEGATPRDVIRAFDEAKTLITAEMVSGCI